MRKRGVSVCHVHVNVLVLVLLLSAAARVQADILTGASVFGRFQWPLMPNTGPMNLFDNAYAGSLVPAWGSTPGTSISVPRQLTASHDFPNYFQIPITTSGAIKVYAAGLTQAASGGLEGFEAGAFGDLTLTFSTSLTGLGVAFQVPGGCTGITLSFITANSIVVRVADDTNCPFSSGGAVLQLSAPICFPASSTLRRLTGLPSAAGAPEAAWETVAVPNLRVGDTVECLARDPVFGRNNATSAAYGRLGRCTVYGYKKALADAGAPYTRIAYDDEPPAGASRTDADAPPAAGAVTMSANHHLLDPLTGQARQAGSLRPGDAVLRATPSGALVPARVRSVASVREGGAYMPLLSGGGLPVVDGVVAYPSSGESDVGLDAKHWGQHYLHAPLWQALSDEAAPAESHGRTLAELGAQAPVAAFTHQWHAVRAAAAREGRATCDWAGVAAEMHAAIAGQGKRYSEAEALAVLDRHHYKALGVAEA